MSSTTTNNPYVDPELMKGLKEFEPAKNKAFESAHKVDKTVFNASNLGSDEKELEIETEPTKKTEQSAQTKIDYELFDEKVFAEEMEEALNNVRKLGKEHQAELIDSIVDDFHDLNGILPSVNDISAIFARIKAVFEEEAAEDEEDYQEELADSEDSDYDETNWQDEAQVLADLEEDYLEDSEDDLSQLDELNEDDDELEKIQQDEADKENREIVKNLE